MNKMALDTNILIYSLFIESVSKEHERCKKIFNLINDLGIFYDKDMYIRNNIKINEGNLVPFNDRTSMFVALTRIINNNITLRTIENLEKQYDIVVPKTVYYEVKRTASTVHELESKNYEDLLNTIRNFLPRKLVKMVFLLDKGNELQRLLEMYENKVVDCKNCGSVFPKDKFTDHPNDKMIFSCCIHNEIYNILTCDRVFKDLRDEFEKENPDQKVNIMTVPVIEEFNIHPRDYYARNYPVKESRSQLLCRNIHRLLH